MKNFHIITNEIKDKDLLIDETKDALEAKYEDQKLETKKMKNKKLI